MAQEMAMAMLQDIGFHLVQAVAAAVERTM